MAYGIDSQINERVDTYSSDPQKLMQLMIVTGKQIG